MSKTQVYDISLPSFSYTLDFFSSEITKIIHTRVFWAVIGTRIRKNPGDALLFFEGALWFFTCPMYSADTRDLGLKSHPNEI